MRSERLQEEEISPCIQREMTVFGTGRKWEPARGPKLTAGPTDERAWNRRAGGRMIFEKITRQYRTSGQFKVHRRHHVINRYLGFPEKDQSGHSSSPSGSICT